MGGASGRPGSGLIQDFKTGAGALYNTKPTGAITNADVYDIGVIVKSVKADIQNIKDQLEQLPPFPQGRPLSPRKYYPLFNLQ